MVPFRPASLASLLLLLALWLPSCGGDGGQDTAYQTTESSPKPMSAPAHREGAEQSDATSILPPEPAPPGPPQTPPVDRPRIVVKNGELALRVDDYSEASQQIQSITTRFNGIVVASNSYLDDDDELRGSITVRIPVARFDEAVREFRRVGDRVLRENIHAEDISASYYDLEARIKNKQRTEERLVEILASAKRVEEIMSVERELSMVREQIEQMQAQRKLMADQAAMSTLTIHLNGEERSGFFPKIFNAVAEDVEGFTDALAAVIVFLIAGLPVIAVVLLLLWLAWRILKRPRKDAVGP